jgi:hypothetical protein
VLARNVRLAHEDLAVEAELGGGGGSRQAVLSRAGFRDDAALSHPRGQQALA